MSRITAILPAYNERPLGSVVLRAPTPRRHGGIVVGDGSQDHTAEVAAYRRCCAGEEQGGGAEDGVQYSRELFSDRMMIIGFGG